MRNFASRFASLALVVMLAGGGLSYGQELPFTLTAPTVSVTSQPLGNVTIFVTIRNTTSFDIPMRMRRLQNALPASDWSSSMCSGALCYPPDADITDMFSVPADSLMHSDLVVNTGVDPGVAKIIVSWDMGPTTQSKEIEFTVSVGTNGVSVSQRVVDNLFPNPTAGAAQLTYSLPSSGDVRIAVSSLQGKEVQVPLTGFQTAGEHSLNLDLSTLASGVYAVTIEAADVRQTRLVSVTR